MYPGIKCRFALAISPKEKRPFCPRKTQYRLISKGRIGNYSLNNKHFSWPDPQINQIMSMSEDLVGWVIGKKMTQFLSALILIFKGDLTKGLRMVNDAKQFYLENDYKSLYADVEYMEGLFYLQLVQRAGPRSLSLIAKNIGFLVKNVLFAGKGGFCFFRIDSCHISRSIPHLVV
jgi:hypothetical protein